jgi:general secretion pathway protein K
MGCRVVAATTPRPAIAGRRNDGFALIMVLWVLVLIAFITAHLVGSGRTEIQIAGNLAANAVAEAAADGAVHQAIFALLDPAPEGRWALDGAERAFTIGDCQVMVTVHDEAARINPNLAAPALLEALLRVTGIDAESARRLVDAINDWVGSPLRPRAPGEVIAQYRAAGLDYAPPSEPAETLDELGRVLGMTPEVLAAIRPHLSLFAPVVPSLEYADPVVAAAMAQATVQVGAGRPRTVGQRRDVVTARIAVVAQGPGNARAARTVVARIMPASWDYAILSWAAELD